MTNKDSPKPADMKVAFDKKEEEWVCCISCGRRLFWAYLILAMNIQVKCGRCGKTVQIAVGDLDIQC